MLLIMVVSLYTSRVILQTLGTQDFGIYNIVGGVVIFFTFISNAMATGTQRHLSYELGKENGDVTTIFSACYKIHLWLALLILVFAETIGLWFLNNKMNFPIDRVNAVNWVYQFSLLSCLISIIKTPYNAAIIAYEKMSFYAYSSIVEVILKLAIVYFLVVTSVDKLIAYGILIALVSALMYVWYILFCRYNLCAIVIKSVCEKGLYLRLLKFSSWSLFGSLANVGYQQGVNIVINIFFGVELNAAVGIANQVNAAVSQFVSGFQQALNPQLVQSEASRDRARQYDLIFKSSKFSYYIMLIISFPIMANLPYLLSIWLGNYPDHTVSICIWILIGVMITCLSGPLWVTIYATAKIRNYQIVVSAVALVVIPIIYFCGLLGMTPEQMFVVRALDYIVVLLVQLFFLKKYINLNLLHFAKIVILPISLVSSMCLGVYFVFFNYLFMAQNLITLIWQTITFVILALLLVWYIGLNNLERNSLIHIAQTKFHHKRI